MQLAYIKFKKRSVQIKVAAAIDFQNLQRLQPGLQPPLGCNQLQLFILKSSFLRGCKGCNPGLQPFGVAIHICSQQL